MGTVDREYSPRPPRDPTHQISMLLQDEPGKSKQATLESPWPTTLTFGGQGPCLSECREEYLPPTVGHVGFAAKRHDCFGQLVFAGTHEPVK